MGALDVAKSGITKTATAQCLGRDSSNNDLSLINYPNIHFVGDSLSSRGIAVSAAQGVYSVQKIYL